jgi:hypothetical protein
MAYPPPSSRQRIPGRPANSGDRFTPPRPAPAGLLAADDRAHRDLDRVGDPAP